MRSHLPCAEELPVCGGLLRGLGCRVARFTDPSKKPRAGVKGKTTTPDHNTNPHPIARARSFLAERRWLTALHMNILEEPAPE